MCIRDSLGLVGLDHLAGEDQLLGLGHTYASMLLEQEINPKIVQKLLGDVYKRQHPHRSGCDLRDRHLSRRSDQRRVLGHVFGMATRNLSAAKDVYKRQVLADLPCSCK